MSVMLQPLQIKSVVVPEGLKGYIYIESFKQTHVKQVRCQIQSSKLYASCSVYYCILNYLYIDIIICFCEELFAVVVVFSD